MKILIVKLSSLGDVLHNLPMVWDLRARYPDAQIDWVVEDSFKEIVEWHPQVRKAIPIHLRRWVKQRDKQSWQEFKAWRKTLRSENRRFQFM